MKKKKGIKRTKKSRLIPRKSKLPMKKGLDISDVYPINKKLTAELKEAIGDVDRFLYSVETVDEDGKANLVAINFPLASTIKLYITSKNILVAQLKADAKLISQNFTEDRIERIIMKRSGHSISSDGTITIKDEQIKDEIEHEIKRQKKRK